MTGTLAAQDCDVRRQIDIGAMKKPQRATPLRRPRENLRVATSQPKHMDGTLGVKQDALCVPRMNALPDFL